MNNPRTLSTLILADILVTVSSAVWDAALGTSPAAEPAAAARIGAGAWTLPGNLGFALWIAVCVGTVLAWIGLLNHLKEARSLYAASWVGYLALAALREPAVASPVGSVLDLSAGLVGGMILGTVYFSDIAARFRSIGAAASEVLLAG